MQKCDTHERGLRTKGKQVTTEESEKGRESVDLAVLHEIVAFPLAGSYLCTGGTRTRPRVAERRADRIRAAPRHSPKSASVTTRRAARVV